MLRRLPLLISLCAVVLLSACSDGTSTNFTRGEYVDGLLVGYKADSTPITAPEARCFAESTVDAIGVNELNRAGVNPATGATSKQVRTLLEADNAAAAKRLGVSISKESCFKISTLLKGQISSGLPGVVDADIQCLSDGLAKAPNVRAGMVNVLIGRDVPTLLDTIKEAGGPVSAACNVDWSNFTPASPPSGFPSGATGL